AGRDGVHRDLPSQAAGGRDGVEPYAGGRALPRAGTDGGSDAGRRDARGGRVHGPGLVPGAARTGAVRGRHDLRRGVEPGARVPGEAGVEAAGGVFFRSPGVLRHEDPTRCLFLIGNGEWGKGKGVGVRAPSLRSSPTSRRTTRRASWSSGSTTLCMTKPRSLAISRWQWISSAEPRAIRR